MRVFDRQVSFRTAVVAFWLGPFGGGGSWVLGLWRDFLFAHSVHGEWQRKLGAVRCVGTPLSTRNTLEVN